MKKMILMIVLIVFLVGCSNEVPIIKMGTGAAGGTYYPLGNAIAELLTDTSPHFIVNAYTGNASVSNAKMIGEKTLDMALVQSNVAYWANNGIGLFEGNKIENIRGIASLYPEMIHIVVRKDAEINSMNDLKGKVVNLGPSDSGNYFDGIKILAAHDIELDEIIVKNMAFKEAMNGFEDGTVDAAFITSGIPTSTVQQIGAIVEIKFLSIDEKIMDDLIGRNKYYSKGIIPKGTYKELDSNLNTLATSAMWICDASLEDDIVYEMTKTFWESHYRIKDAHLVMSKLDVDLVTEGLSIELHDGAKKYYKELRINLED